MISQERLRELLKYNRKTGQFVWRKRHTARALAGAVAGGLLSDGYWGIRIDKRLYRAHRLAWLYVHGEWPIIIDHLDRNPLNNALSNLRNVTQHENGHNSAKVCKGYYKRGAAQYRARIRIGDGKVKNLGTFKTATAAHAAYALAKSTYLPR